MNATNSVRQALRATGESFVAAGMLDQETLKRILACLEDSPAIDGTSKQRLLNGRAARQYCGNVSAMTLWRWVQAGHVRPVNINNGHPLYDQADLDAMIDRAKSSRGARR